MKISGWSLIRLFTLFVYISMFAPIVVVIVLSFNPKQFGIFPMEGVSFRWSILPDDQTFEPGDWSQGFTTIPLPPGSSINLIYTWRHQGENHTGTLEGLRCAPAQPPQR